MGGVAGFTLTYLLFFYCIEGICFNRLAITNNKHADYIRREYIREFPNTKKAKKPAEFDKSLREKYDINKY